MSLEDDKEGDNTAGDGGTGRISAEEEESSLLLPNGQPSHKLVSNFANGLQYLECCLCESLRFHPVVHSSIRWAKQDIEIPEHILFPNGDKQNTNTKKNKNKKFIIRKNDKIQIHHYSTSRNERFFKDANEYRPERYASKGVRTFPAHVFTFFNLNPRLCQGRDFALMEAKIFVYNFFKTYEFELYPKNQDIEVAHGAVANMKNGMRFKLTLR
jgi:cytochrome P450